MHVPFVKQLCVKNFNLTMTQLQHVTATAFAQQKEVCSNYCRREGVFAPLQPDKC